MTEETIFVANAQKGKNAWWRYLLTVVLGFAVQVVVVVAVVIGLMLAGVSTAELLRDAQDPARSITFFGTIGASFALLLVGFVWGGAWLHKKSFSDFIGDWQWGGFAFGVVGWLVLLVVGTVIDYLVRPGGFTVSPVGLTPVAVAVTCVALAVQTFTEEFIFRGWATQGLLRLTRRPVVSAVISGLIFGACHIPNGVFQAISAGLLGIALALIAIRTGGLAFGYGLHLINNLFGALIVVSGADVFKGAPAVFVQNTPGLDVMDLAVVVVALVGLVWIVYRRKG